MKRFFILLAAALLLIGCTAKHQQVPPKLVKSITVVARHGDRADRRYFATDEKMQVLLHHIRAIGIRDTPDVDPDAIAAPVIEITVAFTDGTFKAYIHKADRYFREDQGPWKEIAPEKTQGLYQLLSMMESDPEPKLRSMPPLKGIPHFADLAR